MSLRRALIGLGAAGFVAGALTIVLVLTGSHESRPSAAAALGVAIGWSFIGTGLFAWWRRPENRFGALMTAVGFGWFVSALIESDAPGLHIVGAIAEPLPFVLLIHLLLAFPSGRLEGRLPRVLAAAAYSAVALQVPWALVWDPRTDPGCDCPGHPSNPLLVSDDHAVRGVIVAAQSVVAIAGITTIVVFLVARWRRSSRPQRRALGPVFAGGTPTLVLLLISLQADYTMFPDGRLEDAVDLAAKACLALVPFGFLLGILRSRFERAGGVSDLVRHVGGGGEPGRLRDLLADALGDPSLELAYWLPESERYVDGDGHGIELPPPGGGRVATEVAPGGRRVAAILHDAALDEQRDLVAAAGAAVALALENERLGAELRARVEELRASRTRIVEAGLAERRRLERDLHDGAQQRLVALRLALRLARDRARSDPDAAAELLDGATAELDAALAELRELARGIHPAVLTDRGLEPALAALATRAPLPVSVTASADGLPPAVESAAYFVVAEALTNVAKYAGASSAAVSVARQNGHAVVEIRDDGVGGADPARGSGLAGLADRVAALEGRLDVDSPPGAGTTVRAAIPCG
ncbi:MAG: hypothetical protein QOJ07_392 [Thermoleophilaceae bacterium]|nr:hypothetical protein [Thermoleophilaceae bacterium]